MEQLKGLRMAHPPWRAQQSRGIMAEWIDLGGMLVTLEQQVALAGNGATAGSATIVVHHRAAL